METRKAHLEMIKGIDGRWDGAAVHLGMTRSSLENRVYERKGQQLSTDDSLQLQALSGTTLFAEAIAQASGGMFFTLPEVDADGRDDLQRKFNDLYSHLGSLARAFNDATSDGEVDAEERARLTRISQQIHRCLQGLMALTVQIYCRPEIEEGAAPEAPRIASACSQG